MSRILVLIPAYDAAKTIGAVIDRIPVSFRDHLLVINDGSHDCTQEIVKEMGINLISHRKNLGYGAAQKTGIAFSLKNSYDIVVILHSDGQYPPEKIPELVIPLEKRLADVVIGSRMLQYSMEDEMPVLRYLGNRFLTLLENLVLGSSLTGFHCGLRAYSTHFLRFINYRANSNSFEFDSEILFQAVFKDYIVKEIPIDVCYGQEVSYLKPMRYGFSILKLILKFIFHRYNIVKTEQFS